MVRLRDTLNGSRSRRFRDVMRVLMSVSDHFDDT